MKTPFARPVFELWGLVITETVISVGIMSALVVLTLWWARRSRRWAPVLELLYGGIETSLERSVPVEVGPLLPLIVTLWLFIGGANLLGLLPGMRSPTGDLSLTAALATVALLSGHLYAFQKEGIGYLKHYLSPSPFLLPLNLIGELSRTLALALRLFGNALSGNLIAAISVYLVGLLLPIPLLALSLLTGLVQAYIFGVLTIVFAASAVAARDEKEVKHD